MKNTTAVFLALLLMYGFTTFTFAQTPQSMGARKVKSTTEVFKGTIVSIDPVKNEITVRDNKTGAEKNITVDPKNIGALKVDENVKVTLRAGTNVAERVKEVTKSMALTKKSSK